jgi:hypothetical protein
MIADQSDVMIAEDLFFVTITQMFFKYESQKSGITVDDVLGS